MTRSHKVDLRFSWNIEAYASEFQWSIDIGDRLHVIGYTVTHSFIHSFIMWLNIFLVPKKHIYEIFLINRKHSLSFLVTDNSYVDQEQLAVWMFSSKLIGILFIGISLFCVCRHCIFYQFLCSTTWYYMKYSRASCIYETKEWVLWTGEVSYSQTQYLASVGQDDLQIEVFSGAGRSSDQGI